MKRTDRVTNAIAVLLFLALLAYVGAYVWRALRDATVTAEAVAAEFSRSAVASGTAVRAESVLRAGSGVTVDVAVRSGAKVAAGSVLATVVRGEQGMARANRLHELELEVSRISAALKANSAAGDAAAVSGAARDLAAAVARHDAAALDGASLRLGTLLLAGPAQDVSEARLTALEQELESLRANASQEAETLKAAVSGTFTAQVDGYEFLTPAMLEDLTPAALQALIAREPQPTAGAYGKLVQGHRWYFAAVMDAGDAAGLEAGTVATLNFGRYYSADLYAEVVSVSPPEGGSVAAVFSCDTALADTLGLRTAAADVIFGTYSGVRVPAQAVRTDPETGRTYVWAVTAMQLERKDVSVVYEGEDFVICERSPDPGALREGNTVVVTGTDLYEGKVME